MAIDSPVITLLMVEDNPADVELFTEAVTEAGLALQIETVTDGVEAMNFLRGQGGHVGAFRPDVVVLDLNLPIKSGKDVLAEMMADPRLRGIPVVVLTTSKSDGDICESYPDCKMLYFAKTAEFRELVAIARRIVKFAESNRGRDAPANHD